MKWERIARHTEKSSEELWQPSGYFGYMNSSGEPLSLNGIYNSQEKHLNCDLEHRGSWVGMAVKRKQQIKWKENRRVRKSIRYLTLVNDHTHSYMMEMPVFFLTERRLWCALTVQYRKDGISLLLRSERFCLFWTYTENQTVQSLLKLLSHSIIQSLSSCYYKSVGKTDWKGFTEILFKYEDIWIQSGRQKGWLLSKYVHSETRLDLVHLAQPGIGCEGKLVPTEREAKPAHRKPALVCAHFSRAI